MSPLDGVNSYYEYKMSGGDKFSGRGRNSRGGGCLSGCTTIVVVLFVFVVVLVLVIMNIL